jgi:antitoxin component of MazEF toxin-antitoxin module
MRITKKITTVGGSAGVILDKALLAKLKLKKGDFVEFTIMKAE